MGFLKNNIIIEFFWVFMVFLKLLRKNVWNERLPRKIFEIENVYGRDELNARLELVSGENNVHKIINFLKVVVDDIGTRIYLREQLDPRERKSYTIMNENLHIIIGSNGYLLTFMNYKDPNAFPKDDVTDSDGLKI